MAKIICNGSSSSGNQYVIQTSNECLLLEAGVTFSKVLTSIGYDRTKVKGCLLSHSHIDHAKYADVYSHKGIHIYSNEQCIQSIGIEFPHGRVLAPYKWASIGGFKVFAFKCHHDVENYGYIIKHPEFDPIFFATDTYCIKQNFNGIKNWLIEANYDDDILDKSSIDSRQRERLMVSHMEVGYAVKYLRECNAYDANTITLIHLSSRHSNAPEFKRRVESEFGIPTYIADKDVIIDISKTI